MQTTQRLPRTWSSSSRFVVVCTAAVISLSDFWRLPYLLSQYGGSAFLLIYGLALAAMGLPLFSAQLLMARGADTDIPGVVAAWTRAGPHSRFWVWGACLTLVGAGLLLAAYSVIASWSLAYSLRGVTGGLNTQSPAGAQRAFVALARDPERVFGWMMVFYCLLVATAARGLNRGVEPVMRTLAVCMALAFAALLVAAALDARAVPAARHLFAFDFRALGVKGALEALYQAFFTLSLGTGVIVCFGSYLPSAAPVIRVSVAVILASVTAAIVSAFTLSVFVEQHGVHLGSGLQSVFEVLPVAVGSDWRLPVLFVLVALVSLSTAIGLFEPIVQMVERRSGRSRLEASIYAGLALGGLGLFALLSFGPLARWRAAGYDIFGWINLSATQLIIPLTGLMLCVLMGRVLARRRLVAAWRGETDAGHVLGFASWHALLRYPTRIAMVVVLAYALGALKIIYFLW